MSYVDFKKLKRYDGNIAQAIRNHLRNLEEENVRISIYGEDLNSLIYRIKPNAMYFVGEICEENKYFIIRTLFDVYVDDNNDDKVDDYEKFINSLKNDFDVEEIKRFVRKNNKYEVHICKNHLIELVY